MPTPLKALKESNVPWIWGVVILDGLAFVAFAFPAALKETSETLKWVSKLCGAGLAPVVVLLLSSLLPAETKAMLVFWRLRNILPGHRAFSEHARRDPRVNVTALEKHVGQFPTRSHDQNARWYQLYKKVEAEPSVTLAHRNFLLFRDLSAISLLLALLSIAVLILLGSAASIVWFAGGLFGIQYLATAVAARHEGIGLVRNVLALHSERRRK
jgi:hypothetical protein